MNAEASKELVRHIMEDGFNKQDMSIVHASFHTDYMRHGHGVPSMGSLAEHTEDLLALHSAFDDAHFVIHQMIAEGDTVAVRYTFDGVHTGDYRGAAPTGNRVSRASAAIFTIRDGKVAGLTHVMSAP
jgi:predicted ester cyclase